ncbi:MAG: DUF5686 family protein [Bacteroidota bacterium]
MRKIIICMILFICTSELSAQVSGIVYDIQSQEPLAFAHVIINNTQQGTLTDIDGEFRIPTQNVKTLTVSYVGYEDQTIQLNGKSFVEIYLKSSSEVLKEVIILEGENPAIPIVKKAIANKKSNNPEELPYFTLETYNKFTLASNPVAENTSKEAQFLRETNLFLMESVTEKVYLKPGKYKENVIANRVSGFKNPTFTTLANGIQPFAFYDDYILLLGSQFTNPLGKPGLKKYNYYLEDSILTDHGKIYVILFETKSKSKNQLNGFLHITENQWALENVIARSENYVDSIADGTELAFQIQQKYELIKDQWFPKQLNTNFMIKATTGETLEGIGRTYLDKIDFETEVTKKEVGRVVLSFDQDANKKDSLFWENNRLSKLTPKEIKTYQKIDSLGQANNFDRILTAVNTLASGQVKIGKVGLDLNRIINFNRYEGIRLGAGLHTNKDFSEYISFGGYFGYGFRDEDWKYGGDVVISPTSGNDLKIFAAYSKDVTESGGLNFYQEDNSFSALRDRKILINNMDIVEKSTAGVRFYWLKFLDTEISASVMNTQTTSGYQYLNEGNTNTLFNLSEASIKFRYAPNLQYIESFFQKIPVYDHQPVFWFNYSRGSNFLDGEFNYSKVAFKMYKSSKFKKFGSLKFSLMGVKVFGDAPYPVLFNGFGTYYESFGLETQNGFQTMRFNEFLADEFYGVFSDIYLGRFTIHKKYSKPTFNLKHNMGWGSLENPERHQNFDFKTLDDGFIESGLSVTNLLVSNFSGFGLGVYYRYGPNSFDSFSNNLVFKFNASIVLN